MGWIFAETPFSAISRSNWSPESAEVRPLFRDPKSIPQFGLVAEEVEKVNRNLVSRDAEGKVYTVRYDAVNAMLLNEFLKEHGTVQELKKEIDALKTQLKEQRSLIQSVSDRVEFNGSTPQVVANNQ